MRRWLLLVLASLLAFALPAGAWAQTPVPSTETTTEATPEDSGEDEAQERGGDNVALAVNTKDDSSLIKFAFDIRRVMNGVVDQSNAAVAVASCEDCLTIAVAIQVVMVTSDPEVVTPENIAIALNTECTSCETFAAAYQYVFTTGGNVRFTGEGQQQINDIRRAIADLLEQGLDFATLDAELDALVEQLYAVVDSELVPVASDVETDVEEGGSEPDPEASPAPSDGSGATPATEEEPTTEPSEAPTEEPTPQPSDT